MSRIAFVVLLSAALLTTTAVTAQTRTNAPAGKKTGSSGKVYPAQPARTSTKPTAGDGNTASPATDPKMEPLMESQGESVAPGMSGAPPTRVTTDYEGRPEKKTTNSSTLSSPKSPAAQPKTQ
ncbi:hypothetical protein [Hymenobacter sp. GOD-10R]|uniref:hypothetical protein n=1 Tax=Hymenobacter sp. GOD-10R TaxID=3093922 RepID=UPI002D7974FA|nr:hypothetical protein [Hymenobacter sp. GOD-10R]WRQ28945.1 hypothetical protein SD425_01540 [Hymenobacter sp. GOD-10R]